jgi:membrane-associated phospholipid phosphatase
MLITPILEWGLHIIRLIRTISSPALDTVIKTLTHAGSPAVALLIIFFIYWSVDREKGFKLFFLIFISFALNIILKNAFKIPRPFIFDPSVNVIPETGFSMPSGHAQGTATFWTLFAWVYMQRSKKLRWVCVFGIPVFVSFTRVYLGVHFPTDVLSGLAVGYLCAVGEILFYDSVAARITPLRKSLKLLGIAVVCLAANGFSGGDVSASAALFGFTAGYIRLDKTVIPYKEIFKTLPQKAFGCAFGGFLCCALYLIFKGIAHIPGVENFGLFFDFVRYAAIGLAGACSPAVYVKLTALRSQKK